MFRLDKIQPGTKVSLAFHKRASTVMVKGGRVDEEDFIFLGIQGTGENREAVFAYPEEEHNTWHAYRFNGHWASGSSAERLSVVAVHG